MNKDQITNLLEDINVQPRILPHKQNLRRELLNSEYFNRSKKGSFVMSKIFRNPLAVTMAVVVLAVGIVWYQTGNSGRAQAREYVKTALSKIQTLPDSQVEFLTHSLGNEPEEWLNEAYNAKDLELSKETIKIGLEDVSVNLVTFTNSKGEKVSLYFTDDNIVTSVSVYNPNISLEEWQKQSASKYTQDKNAFQYHIGEYTKKQMATIVRMGNESDDLKLLGEETIDRQTTKKYRFTDKYTRVITYSIDNDGVIKRLEIDNYPQGTKRTSTGQDGVPNEWEIYSSAFGYEIAYPKNWFTLDSSLSLPYSLTEYAITPTRPEGFNSPGNVIQIVVNENTLENEMVSMAGEPKEEMFNGYKVITYSSEFYKIYLLENGGRVYKINVSTQIDYAEHKNTIDSIIATFKIK